MGGEIRSHRASGAWWRAVGRRLCCCGAKLEQIDCDSNRLTNHRGRFQKDAAGNRPAGSRQHYGEDMCGIIVHATGDAHAGVSREGGARGLRSWLQDRWAGTR